jgi:hypothetical protein
MLSRGMCRKHYNRWYRRRETAKQCRADGCPKPPYSSGWCPLHWNRLKRHGSPDINLRDGGERKVSSTGYVLVRCREHPAAINGRVAEHRLVMEEELGRYLLPGENIHHRNGNRADNTPQNLELWVTKQPAGQRVEDLLAWAREIISRYDDGRIRAR